MTAPPETECRPLTPADLEQVVTIHCDAFPDSALTMLGRSVVAGYYRWQFVGPHPFPYASGAWRGTDLVGFIFGGTRDGAVSGFVRNSMGTIAVGLIRHPRAVGHLAGLNVLPVLRLVARRRRSTGRSAEARSEDAARAAATPEARSFGVLSVAVAPVLQGTGIAVQLMEGAEQAAVAAGYQSMHLTVGAANHRALRFYQKLGWSTSSPAGDGGQVMVKPLTM